jgi:ubiquinone/menaquinone biosynthesis C-methylase UbiE
MAEESFDVVMARSREEVDPPSLSARALEPFTRSFLSEAAIAPGMRVLDTCSGTGDLAFLLREIVGPEGHVTGVDPSSQAVDYAKERAAFRGFANLEFVDAELDGLPTSRDFDAIVGRGVLLYRRDPVHDLRTLARLLRPGGTIAFQEFDLLSAKTVPPTPLLEQAHDWLIESFAGSGVEREMGPKLYAAFMAAGLPPPQMRVDGLIGGAESVSFALVANVVRRLMPQKEGLEADTLEERMRAELARTGGVLMAPLLVGAWSKLPD